MEQLPKQCTRRRQHNNKAACAFYEALGRDAETRQETYRELFRYELDPSMIDQIRTATNGNYVLGNALFKAQIAEALGRRVEAGKAGRPRLEG